MFTEIGLSPYQHTQPIPKQTESSTPPTPKTQSLFVVVVLISLLDTTAIKLP